jgi:hypothetical protein
MHPKAIKWDNDPGGWSASYARWIKNRRRVAKLSQRRVRDRVRAKILEVKKAGCRMCPEKHPAALDFHHRDRKQKKFTVSSIIERRRPWNIVLEEIEKCDILCRNCHAKLHYAERA